VIKHDTQNSDKGQPYKVVRRTWIMFWALLAHVFSSIGSCFQLY